MSTSNIQCYGYMQSLNEIRQKFLELRSTAYMISTQVVSTSEDRVSRDTAMRTAVDEYVRRRPTVADTLLLLSYECKLFHVFVLHLMCTTNIECYPCFELDKCYVCTTYNVK